MPGKEYIMAHRITTWNRAAASDEVIFFIGTKDCRFYQDVIDGQDHEQLVEDLAEFQVPDEQHDGQDVGQDAKDGNDENGLLIPGC